MSRVPTFPHFYILSCPRDSAYPSSHGSTGSIESTTSQISSLSNRNANNTRSVTLAPSSLASFLKVQSTLNSVIRGVLLFKLFWWPIFLIPPVRSLASKRYAYVIAIIFLFSEIMPTYSRYVLKGLVCVIIIAPLGRQPSFCTKCTKLNIYLSCNIRSVFNIECVYLIYSYILQSLQLFYLIYLRVLYNSCYEETQFWALSCLK